MNKAESMNQEKFIWSYPFLYYTLLKHYRKEKHGVSDIAPWMAMCFLTFWWSVLYVSSTIFLVGNCYPNFLEIKIFSEEYDWFNRAAVYCVPFISNAIFFFYKKRYLVYEQNFDSLPLKIRKRGIKISWGIMYSGFVFTLLMMWWFASSPC